MKIGYVLDQWPAFSETFLIKELELFIAAGHQVVVYTKVKPEASMKGIEVFTQNTPVRSFLKHFKQCIRLLKIEIGDGLSFIKALRRSVKNAHFFNEQVDVIIFTYAYQFHERKNIVTLKKSKSVVWLRGRDVLVYPFTGPENYLSSLSYATHVISRSRHLANVLHTQLPDTVSKTTLIPSSIDIKNENMAWAASDPIKLVAISRLYAYKGLTTAIDALSLVRDTRTKLTIVGGGPHRRLLEKHAKKRGVTARVSFAGRKTHDETLEILKKHDVLVHGSLIEGVSNAVLEAMSMGILCITADSPGNVVQNELTGLTFKPYDYKMLAHLINKLPTINVSSYVKEAFLYVKEHHSAEKVHQKYLDTLVSIV